MKTFVALSALLAVCTAFVDHELIVQRAKRQIGSFSDLRSLNCVRGCLINFKETMETLQKTQRQFFKNNALLDKKNLNKFCGSYQSFAACIDDCGVNENENGMANTIVSMFHSFEMICVTRRQEFESYIPCYTKAAKPIDTTCVKKCGDPQAFAEGIQRKLTEHAPTDTRGLIRTVNDIMEEACDHGSCHQHCQSGLIRQKCPGETGQNAADLLSTFARDTIQSMSRGLKLVAPQMVIPGDCLSRGTEESSEEENDQASDEDLEREAAFLF